MGDFDDLIAANREFAADFDLGGFDGVAHAGVAIVTCMDSRIDPLRMLGPRSTATPRSSATRAAGSPPHALEALVLGVHLLGVRADPGHPAHPLRDGRPTPSPSCARRSARRPARTPRGSSFHVIADQLAALAEDVKTVQSHPLIPDTVAVGGFVYDVDTGLIDQKF